MALTQNVHITNILATGMIPITEPHHGRDWKRDGLVLKQNILKTKVTGIIAHHGLHHGCDGGCDGFVTQNPCITPLITSMMDGIFTILSLSRP